MNFIDCYRSICFIGPLSISVYESIHFVCSIHVHARVQFTLNVSSCLCAFFFYSIFRCDRNFCVFFLFTQLILLMKSCACPILRGNILSWLTTMRQLHWRKFKSYTINWALRPSRLIQLHPFQSTMLSNRAKCESLLRVIESSIPSIWFVQ